MNKPSSFEKCARCGKVAPAHRVRVPRWMWLCQSCFDAWRQWYLGDWFTLAPAADDKDGTPESVSIRDRSDAA